MQNIIETVLAQIDTDFDRSVERLGELISYQSISTDPRYTEDCRRAALALDSDLRDVGFSSQVVETDGHPIVFATALIPDTPHVLIYGHYDVQPAGAAEEWSSDPFRMIALTDENGETKLVGRGTSDDKGQIATLNGTRGIYTSDMVREAIRPKSLYEPRSRLLLLEQTCNYGGGTVWPIEQIEAVTEVARSGGLKVHIDGARLMNACVESGNEPVSYAQFCDTIWLDFTKGLGAPLGAVIAGSQEFIDEAIRWRQAFGGGLRQAGICAAACIYALDNNIERLADDHRNAKRLAEGLASIQGLEIDASEVETNIVFARLKDGEPSVDETLGHLRDRGIRIGAMNGYRMLRMITHLDISNENITTVLTAFEEIFE